MSLSRRAYVIISWILLACILLQVFLAGLGVFVNPARWAEHRMFVHFFELLPLVLFALTFPARLNGLPRWLPLGVLVLIGLQYATAGSRPAFLAAFHTVIALLMAWAALQMARTDVAAPNKT